MTTNSMQYFFANRSISKPYPDVTEIQNPFLTSPKYEKCRPRKMSTLESFLLTCWWIKSTFGFPVPSLLVHIFRTVNNLNSMGDPRRQYTICLKIEISENTAENFVQSQEHISCLLLLEYFFKTHTANGEVSILHGSTVEHQAY